jgi:hypothetical protein
MALGIKETTRETVGKVSSELRVKEIDNTHSAHDQMQESLVDYEKNIFECLLRMKNDFPHKDFFIVVISKNERIMKNVFRSYFLGRVSCPTPDYDQSVYHYHWKEERLEFLWVIPSKKACKQFLMNRVDIMPEEWQLLKYVLDFSDGTLYREAKKRNGECEDSVKLKTTK